MKGLLGQVDLSPGALRSGCITPETGIRFQYHIYQYRSLSRFCHPLVIRVTPWGGVFIIPTRPLRVSLNPIAA